MARKTNLKFVFTWVVKLLEILEIVFSTHQHIAKWGVQNSILIVNSNQIVETFEEVPEICNYFRLTFFHKSLGFTKRKKYVLTNRIIM